MRTHQVMSVVSSTREIIWSMESVDAMTDDGQDATHRDRPSRAARAVFLYVMVRFILIIKESFLNINKQHIMPRSA